MTYMISYCVCGLSVILYTIFTSSTLNLRVHKRINKEQPSDLDQKIIGINMNGKFFFFVSGGSWRKKLIIDSN